MASLSRREVSTLIGSSYFPDDATRPVESRLERSNKIDKLKAQPIFTIKLSVYDYSAYGVTIDPIPS